LAQWGRAGGIEVHETITRPRTGTRRGVGRYRAFAYT
jgi:hypothetical protein